MDKCEKCCLIIDDEEDYVICHGFCEAVYKFHTQCTGLNENELEACKNTNVFWVCDKCRFLLNSVRFRRTINAFDDVHKMQQTECNKTVDDLKESITHLNDSIKSLLEMKKLETASESKTDVPVNSGTPLSSTRIEKPAEISTDQRSETFKLFLSNIDRRVTEADIYELVSLRVGTLKPFSVKRLVPAWKQLADLEYISFKIELDVQVREKALSPGCWPPGMRYREFRDRNRDVHWSPPLYRSFHRHNEMIV